MSYSYTKLSPHTADVDTLATNLAQRQSDSATTNGGITASGGSASVPQLGVDAAGLGTAYLTAMADATLLSCGYQDYWEYVGSSVGIAITANVWADAPYSSRTFTAPITRAYIIHVNMGYYMTVGTGNNVRIGCDIDGTSYPTQPVYQFIQSTSQIQNTAFTFATTLTAGTHTFKAQFTTPSTGITLTANSNCRWSVAIT